MTLTPAYGRDYKSAVDVMKAFNDGLDFIINQISHKDDGRYVTKRELIKAGWSTINIRYNKKRRVIVVNLGEQK